MRYLLLIFILLGSFAISKSATAAKSCGGTFAKSDLRGMNDGFWLPGSSMPELIPYRILSVLPEGQKYYKSGTIRILIFDRESTKDGHMAAGLELFVHRSQLIEESTAAHPEIMKAAYTMLADTYGLPLEDIASFRLYRHVDAQPLPKNSLEFVLSNEVEALWCEIVIADQ